ncbi:MAG: E3 binding domain-containing protein [Planctomycetota bacterium]
MISELTVPYLGTAEDDVLLSQWYVAEGDPFVKGQVVAAVDTLKASFDVEAAADGVLLRRLVDAGTRVPLQAVLALVGAVGSAVPAAALDQRVAALRKASASPAPGAPHVEAVRASPPAAPAPKPAPPQSAPPVALASAAPVVPASSSLPTMPRRTEPAAAPAARQLARELGLDLDSVRGRGPGGLIRFDDVQAAARDAVPPAASGDGRVAPSFLALVRADRVAFGALASEFKVALYRQNGAILGPGVVFERGAVLLVDHLELGSEVLVGEHTVVEARELRAGDRLQIGRGGRMHCRRIAIGDEVRFADGVEIDGSETFGPDAELVVGSQVSIGERVRLDPSHRLEIADGVVIECDALLTTQFVGGSILRGRPVRCESMRIGIGALVGRGATVLPGAELGDESVLLANSTLVDSVPSDRLWGGVPAIDLRAAGQEPSPERFAELARGLVLAFARSMQVSGGVVQVREAGDQVVLTVADGERVRRLSYAATPVADGPMVPLAEDVRVAAHVGDGEFRAAADHASIDLSGPRLLGAPGPLAQAFCGFLARRGVRVAPA